MPTEGINNRTLNFPAFTGIRAFAVYLVYLHHTNPFPTNREDQVLYQLVREFHVGVSIFFVLSGFLITHRYYHFTGQPAKWLGTYVQNRVARVYPMYFLLTSVSAILLFVQSEQGESSLKIYLMNISFLKGFFDELKFTLIAQGWSLTVEECFYFLAPLIFIALRKTKWFLIVLPLGLVLLGSLLVKTFAAPFGDGFFVNYSFMFMYTFFGRSFEFFCGVALALYLKNNFRKERVGFWYTFAGLTFWGILVVLMASYGGHLETGIYSVWGLAINNFILPMSTAILFYGLIVENSMVRRVLSSRLFALLGKTSYTFYLVHVGFIYVFVNQYISQNYILVFLILNLIAIGLWYFVEEPLNRLIRGASKTNP